MRILLISGHGAGDCGAVGNGLKEANLTRELVNLVAVELKKYASVSIYDKSRNAYKDAKNGKLNIPSCGYALEIHFNAHSNVKAHGTEIYITTSEKGYSVEKKMLKRLEKYFTNRGVKRNNFLVIRKIKNKGISSALLEVCFISNKDDIEVYKKNKVQIGKDIAVAIAEGFGLKKLP